MRNSHHFSLTLRHNAKLHLQAPHRPAPDARVTVKADLRLLSQRRSCHLDLPPPRRPIPSLPSTYPRIWSPVPLGRYLYSSLAFVASEVLREPEWLLIGYTSSHQGDLPRNDTGSDVENVS